MGIQRVRHSLAPLQHRWIPRREIAIQRERSSETFQAFVLAPLVEDGPERAPAVREVRFQLIARTARERLESAHRRAHQLFRLHQVPEVLMDAPEPHRADRQVALRVDILRITIRRLLQQLPARGPRSQGRRRITPPPQIIGGTRERHRPLIAHPRVVLRYRKGLVVLARAAVDAFEEIEPPDRLELVSKVEEHEPDQLFRFGTGMHGAVALLARHPAGRQRGHRQQQQQDTSRPRQTPRPPVLPHVFADQRLLALAAERRGQLRHGLAEARIAKRQVLGRPGPPEVEVQRLVAERALQGGRQGGWPLPVEVVSGPRQLAAGHDDEQGVDGSVGAPPLDFTIDPGGGGRLRARHEDEKVGRAERGLDRRPESGADREAGLVAEDADRADAIPRLGEPVQRRLQDRAQLFVGGVAVREECAVWHRYQTTPNVRANRW